ncbi:hypothetical protein [Hydrogenophaga sp.]|uniref:hypothetical protein n=1 Tax=Hydrogenophaga sp. TaxID=1904254 RepID=UPI0027229EDE|nr:hypothetical protein [Hydrogenophaga sp.]MDO9434325.1 hypothetical protein [Hydrogenophaga sp.]
MTRITSGPFVSVLPSPWTDIDRDPRARARTPQGALVSLAEPPFGAENQSLESVLLERVARCATPMPAHVSAKRLQYVDDAVERLMPFDTLTDDPSNGPGRVLRDWTDQDEAATRLLTAAVDLIVALDQRDEVPTTDGEVLQEAVHLLLALGQPALLGRLAQLRGLNSFFFEVGLNPRSASVLERIGASWPPEAAVSITLDPGLSTPCMIGMRAFLQCPTSLSVHVRAGGTRDVNAARELAETIGRRPLAQLTLDIHELSTDLLQALVGVQACTLCIRPSRLFKALHGPSAPSATNPLAEGTVAAYQDAAFELVRKSGARVIRLPQSHLEGNFCARLLAINDHWDAVELNLSRPSAARDWLIAGRQTIGELALTAWTGNGAADVADLLAWEAKNRVLVLRRCCIEPIRTLGRFLLPDADPQALVNYLKAPTSPLVNPMASHITVSLQGTILATKLGAFKQAGLESRLIRGAVAYCVRAQPALGLKMFDALVALDMQPRQPSQQDWEKLGSRYATTWLKGGPQTATLGGFAAAPGWPAPTSVAAVDGAHVAPAAGVSSAATTPAQTHLVDLVTPSTPQRLEEVTEGYEALVESCSQLDARFKARKDAFGLVLGLLQEGTFDVGVLNAKNVATELANHLLQGRQGKILSHIVQHAPGPRVWRLDAIDADVVAEIAKLQRWPEDPACRCDLRIGTELGLEDLQRLADFVADMKPEQLTVRLAVYPYAKPEMVARIVNAHPGVALSLHCWGKGIPAAEPLVNLLGSLKVPLRALVVDGPRLEEATPILAITALIRDCSVTRLEAIHCAPAFEDEVLSCVPWDSLKLSCSTRPPELFAAGKVSARQLHIVAPSQDSLVSTVVETMIATCKGLNAVVIEGAAVQALSLARALDRNRGVRSFDAALATASQAHANEALTIFRRNTSIARVNLRALTLVGSGLAALTLSFNGELAQLVTRNRLRHPALLRGEAANSLVQEFAGGNRGQAGQLLEDMLEPADVLALSLTNKAAYARSRQPWEREIDRLAALFSATTGGAAFKEQLVWQLTHLDGEFTEISDTVPSAHMPADTVMQKVTVMQSAGVPNGAIVQALGRALSLDKDASRDLLEAMLVMGALPSDVWLKEVLDIELDDMGVPL